MLPVMKRKLVYLALLAAAALVVPGSSDSAQAETNLIRIAMLAPQESVIVKQFKKIDADIRKATNDAWGLRIYASGVAGDETDTVRKMKVGQLDGSVFTTTGLSQILPSIAIFDVPGVINSYDELDAVNKAMLPDFEGMFEKNGYKLLHWWETGKYRTFSKGPTVTLADYKKHRPWVWPISVVLKTMWETVGVSGIPLGVPDVFGALQTGMIDLVTATPMVMAAMQWHRKLDHVTSESAGILLMAWVINKPTWDKIPPEVQKVFVSSVKSSSGDTEKFSKDEDEATLKKLMKVGYTATTMNAQQKKDFENQVSLKVQKKLAGRIYPESMLTRIAAITKPIR